LMQVLLLMLLLMLLFVCGDIDFHFLIFII
jgi:hypothetical protein